MFSNQEILLAKCLSGKSKWSKAVSIGITADSFDHGVNRDLWLAIDKTFSDPDGGSTSRVALNATMDGTKHLISAIMSNLSNYHSTEVEDITNIVLAESKLKDVAILSNCITDDIKKARAGDDISRLVTAIDELKERSAKILNIETQKKIDGSSQALEYTSLFEKRLEDKEAGVAKAISTGIPTLDECLGGGYIAHRLILVGGRSGSGKTQFAVNAAYNAYMDGHKVMFFSCEMVRQAIMDRLIARATGIDSRKLESGELTDHETDKLFAAIKKFSERNCLIYDDFDRSIPRISSLIAQQMREADKPRLVIIDYAQAMFPSTKQKDILQRLQDCSTEIKQITMKYPVCVLALCQLNREACNDSPELHNIRGNDSFAHDCDAAILWHTDEQLTEAGGGLIKLRKMRYGKEATFSVAVDFSTSRITDMSADERIEFAKKSKKTCKQKTTNFGNRFTGRQHTGTVD